MIKRSDVSQVATLQLYRRAFILTMVVLLFAVLVITWLLRFSCVPEILHPMIGFAIGLACGRAAIGQIMPRIYGLLGSLRRRRNLYSGRDAIEIEEQSMSEREPIRYVRTSPIHPKGEV